MEDFLTAVDNLDPNYILCVIVSIILILVLSSKNKKSKL